MWLCVFMATPTLCVWSGRAGKEGFPDESSALFVLGVIVHFGLILSLYFGVIK